MGIRIHAWILWELVALEFSIGFALKKSASPALCTVCATAIGSETRHTWQQVHHPNTVKSVKDLSLGDGKHKITV